MFIKYEGAATEYQGESFTKTLAKRDATAWDITDEANYVMKDQDGATIDSGNLTKVNSDFGFKFEISKTVTAPILGTHIVLVYLTNTGNLDFADVIAEYVIVYNEVKAT